MRVSLLIQILGDAVDPSKAEGLFDRVIVRNTGLFGLPPVVNQPDFIRTAVMLCQPLSPIVSIGNIQRRGYVHGLFGTPISQLVTRRANYGSSVARGGCGAEPSRSDWFVRVSAPTADGDSRVRLNRC